MRAQAVVNAAAVRDRPALLARLRATLGRDGVHVTADLAAVPAAARAVLAAGPDVVFIGGGDGTFVRVLAALDEAAAGRPLPALVPLPWGTGNGLARSVGVEATTVTGLDRALARAAGGARRPWPLLAVLGLRAPFAGFGVDAAIVADQARVRARLPTWLPARGALAYAVSVPLRSLPAFAVGRRALVEAVALAPATILDRDGAAGAGFATGDRVWRGRLTLAACSTVRAFGFGLAMFPHADGRADRFVLRIGDPGLGEIVTRAADAFAGRYFSPRVTDVAATVIALAVDRPQPFEVAGEPVGDHDRVEVRLAPPMLLAV